MIKKTISFVDFNNTTRSEEHYFNLTKADVVQMELGAKGNSLTEYLQQVVNSENGAELLAVLDDFLSKSYGVKSVDGRNFMKSPEIYAQFRSSNAYSEFFMEMLENPTEMARFFTELINVNSAVNPDLSPSEQARQASEALMQGRKAAETKSTSFVKTPDVPTMLSNPDSVQSMTTAELEALLEQKRAGQ